MAPRGLPEGVLYSSLLTTIKTNAKAKAVSYDYHDYYQVIILSGHNYQSGLRLPSVEAPEV